MLGLGLSKVCFEGPESEVTRTDIAQAAIYTTSVACCEALKEQGVIDPAHLTTTAGLSLGEYTALHLAGAFGFEDGLQLVRQRGLFMQEAATASPSGMVALIGADEAQARRLCDEATSGASKGVLVAANFNCPGQVVVSGSQDACERALEVAAKMGLRAAVLPVAGAFHSPLMEPARVELEEAIRNTEFTKPICPVYQNANAKAVSKPEDIQLNLIKQLTAPVRWTQSVQQMIADGADEFIEIGPGNVLQGLIKKIDRTVATRGIQSLAVS